MSSQRWKGRAQRGNAALLFALLLPVLLGFIALAVDFGHFWHVKNQLQNAADAASLAGARDLDGTAAMFPVARQSAHDLGYQNQATLQPVNLDLNVANDPSGDIVLGRWDFSTQAFTPAGPTMPSYQVNAVQVQARRTAQEGGSVATFFASFLGHPSQDISAHGIAVGGSPASACGAPLSVADCSLYGADGTLRCNQTLTFGSTNSDAAGFTLLSAANPTTPTVTCLMARALKRPCPSGCDCSITCNAISTSDGAIKISNGNNLSQQTVKDINAAVAGAGPNGVYLHLPVVDSGGLGPSNCSSFIYNSTHAVVGFVNIKITGATFAPNKQVFASVDCTHQDAGPPGGDFFGYKATELYLVQ